MSDLKAPVENGKDVKVTIGCRVPLSVKQKLEKEASELGFSSFSQFLEEKISNLDKVNPTTGTPSKEPVKLSEDSLTQIEATVSNAMEQFKPIVTNERPKAEIFEPLVDAIGFTEDEKDEILLILYSEVLKPERKEARLKAILNEVEKRSEKLCFEVPADIKAELKKIFDNAKQTGIAKSNEEHLLRLIYKAYEHSDLKDRKFSYQIASDSFKKIKGEFISEDKD